MSVYRGSCDWAAYREWRRERPGAWHPLELAAMITGFVVFWPVGLAILFAKIGQKREGYAGNLFAYAKDKFGGAVPAGWNASRESWASRFAAKPFGMRNTGNSAFDEWRAGELERLEAERRKLADAEREFGEHLDRLRRARDREEFDRFMSERNAKQTDGTTSV